MTFRPLATVAALLVAGASIPALTQEDAAAQGDAERGRQLAYTCYGCHGIENYKNVYPTYSVPKLQGQHPEYLVLALQAYKNGERSHTTMHAQAASMSEQDMRDIAAFLAGEALQPKEPAAQAAGNVPAAAQTCVACHGTDGVGITPLYPTLSGQHEDYIARALSDYRSGMRKNAVMASFAGQLSDQDIRELARYYSRQRPGLSTAEHSNWFVAK